MSPRCSVRPHESVEALLEPGAVRPSWFNDMVEQIWTGTILIDIEPRASLTSLLSVFIRPIQYLIVKIAHISEIVDAIHQDFQSFCGSDPDKCYIDEFHPFAIYLIFQVATDVALHYGASQTRTLSELVDIFSLQGAVQLPTLPWISPPSRYSQSRRSNRGKGTRTTNPPRTNQHLPWFPEPKEASEVWYPKNPRGQRQPREPRYPRTPRTPREQQPPACRPVRDPPTAQERGGAPEYQSQPNRRGPKTQYRESGPSPKNAGDPNKQRYFRPPRMLKPPRAPRLQRMPGISKEDPEDQGNEWVAGINSYTLKDLQQAEAEAYQQHTETTKQAKGGCNSEEEDEPFLPSQEIQDFGKPAPEPPLPTEDVSSSDDDVVDCSTSPKADSKTKEATDEWGQTAAPPAPRSLHTFF
ncbi:hypothetical protein [Macropodid alphaherpesvirus 1]|uniref:Uncharacterized protein n=1 Tax=Macropodid alphaherpesvirus 1 TaxID=137443 RepID=A0A109QMA4_9ALPH|nr:hypothetical protein [Macropodid alphaherpesvirus 1]AMB17030.1 hypothetical protein [Macropodid alphaherpesvirus 1]